MYVIIIIIIIITITVFAAHAVSLSGGKKKAGIGFGDANTRSSVSYLLVVDREEAEHGSEHGTGSHKVAQATNMVGDEIPVHKQKETTASVQFSVAQQDKDVALQQPTKALKSVCICLNGGGGCKRLSSGILMKDHSSL